MIRLILVGLLLWITIAQIVMVILWHVIITKNPRQDIVKNLTFEMNLLVICTTIGSMLPGRKAYLYRAATGLGAKYRLKYVPYLVVFIIVYPAIITTSFVYGLYAGAKKGWRSDYGRSHNSR